MKRGWKELALCSMLLAPALAHAQVDLSTLDRDMTGPRTQILVVGMVHLSEQKDFKVAALDPLLDRLAAYQPDYIAIESISGEQCDTAARHPSVYGDDYCGHANTDKARAATGLDIPAAIAEVDKTLATWPAQPTAAQRRHLAALFLAAGERASAYVQWLRLPPPERRAGDGLDAALVEVLRKTETVNNEDFQIAAQLAARLGHDRVYPVDDHTGDNHKLADMKAFGASVEQAWKAGRGKLDEIERQEEGLAKGDDLLPLYRMINDPKSLAVYADVNAGAALRATSPAHYPQIWVNGWEIRNLRMVANILQVVRDHPGTRVLSIVGVSHKPWFDAWLGQMQGVEIVDAEQALR